MNTPLNTHLAAAIAAPEQAPNGVLGGVAGGGATLVGLLIAAYLIAKWKDHIKGDTRRYVILAMIMATCLTGTAGVVGGFFNSAKTTAGTVGTTLTQTTTGQ